jgi:hypothetical protein
MGPIEETFAREYPDYEPFPFGVGSWLQTLVRAIVLAEPMIKDFEKLFEQIDDDDTVVALAESFAFGNCVRRQRLAETIAARAGG